MAGFALYKLAADGVKKAAEVLAPTVASLKKEFSDLAKTRLTPMFREFAQVLDGPEWTGLRNVENSAIDLFTDLVRVTTTQEGMRQVQEALNGVSDLVQTSARSEDARPRSSRQGGAA